ncbi:MAG: sugar ABC transporter permease [Brevinematales bacterium]|nr:sugar ABC transporter permease [Brevinematales bacterium]
MYEVGRFSEMSGKKVVTGKKRWYHFWKYYLWMFPAFLLVVFFLVIPTFQTIVMSFQVPQRVSVSEMRKEFIQIFSEVGGIPVERNTLLQEIPNWQRGVALFEQRHQFSYLEKIEDTFSVNDLVEISYMQLKERKANRWGFDHYQRMFTDSDMLIAFRNNVLWLVVFTVFTVSFGLGLAKLLMNIRWAPIAKTIIFVPMAISYVAAGVIWSFMYDKDVQIGTVNAVIDVLNHVGSFFRMSSGYYEGIAFLGRPETVNFALIAAGVWMWVGFCMTVFSAALAALPHDVREAAMVDGATPVQTFFLVEVPMLLPTITVVTTTMVINVLKVFDIVYTMTQGGPYGSSEVLANRMYRTAFNEGNFEYAAAMAVILFLCIIPVMIGNIKSYYIEESQR